MKKSLVFLIIIFLIVVTNLTKNSSIKLETEIFNIKENIGILKHKYELVLLDYNYLTAPQKLLNYQSYYFENELHEIDLTSIKKLVIESEKITIQDFNDFKNE